MNSALGELWRRVGPQNAAIVLVVALFLGYQHVTSKRWEAVSDRCHAVSELYIETSKEIANQNAALAREVAEALGRCTGVLDEVHRLLHRMNGARS